MNTKNGRLLLTLSLGLGVTIALMWLLNGESPAVALAHVGSDTSVTSDSTTIFTEGFEISVPPPGWIEEDVSGTGGDWAQSGDTVHPSGESVHSGSYLAYFNSWTADPGDATRIYTTNLDFSEAGNYYIGFWVYHDVEYSVDDSIQIEADDGSGWADVGSAVPRYNGSTGWAQHTVNLSTYAGDVISLSIKGVSDYGNDIHIDDIHAYRQPPAPHFDITKIADTAEVALGSALTYTVVVTNVGAVDATDTALTDTLDVYQQPQNVTASQGTCGIANADWGGVFTCTLGNVAVNASVHVTFTAQTTSTAIARWITNTVWVTGGDDEASAQVSTWLSLFTDIGVSLPGDGPWGDYDNDGDLDVLAGSKVYRNDGGGVFADTGAALTSVFDNAGAWGDYDNDGDLDILLTGIDGGDNRVAEIYRNDGGGVFTDIGAALTGVADGSVAWGDYDNDGDLDILLTGNVSDYSGVSKVYRNDGGSLFTDIGAGLPGTEYGSATWGDYDNDGDLDILLAEGVYYGSSWVYRNDGNGIFTDIGAGLPDNESGSAVWGDYDNDGDLDILLTEYFGLGLEAAEIYRNDGGGAFTDVGVALGDCYMCPVGWSDCDNDGDLDVYFGGEIYRNDGEGAFTNIDAALPDGGSFWGDYDNDGDLDILSGGRIYRNNAATANTAPSVPTGLTASFVGQDAIFSWNAADDAQTPVDGLTYNLRVGTTPGGTQILAPMAADTGYRRVPQPSNVGYGLSATLKNLPYGTYYWSVQTVDTVWAGSSFASEGSLAPAPVAGLSIGPKWAYPSASNLFIATVTPLTATQPITYTWQASGQTDVTHTGGGLEDTITFTWPAGTASPQIITVTASNPVGVFTGTQLITIRPPSLNPYTLLVDTPIDSNAPAYQACTTAVNDCSLRGAISKANADTGNSYTIKLPSGAYMLALSGDDDDNAVGDLDIKNNVMIAGVGAGFTTINGNQLDRVLHIHGDATVIIDGVQITGGLSGQGGGIYTAPGTMVALGNVRIIGNTASETGEGGGIYNAGVLTLMSCTLDDNQAQGDAGQHGQGGGIYNTGVLTLTNSAVIDNIATGAIGGTGSPGIDGATGSHGTYPAGTGGLGGAGEPGGTGGTGRDGRGGGVYNASALYLINTTLDGNRAQGGDGGTGGPGGAGGEGGGGGDGASGGVVAYCPVGYVCTIYEGWGGDGGTGGTGGTGGSGGTGGTGGDGLGGGLYNTGTVSLRNVTLSGNQNKAGAAGCGGSSGTFGWGGDGGSGGLCYSECSGGGTCVCEPGRTGDDGDDGGNGTSGSNGSNGLPGSTHGGGIYAVGSGVTFNNTLVAANDAQTGPDGYGQLTVEGHNFIETTVGYTLVGEIGAVLSGTVPQLGPLQDNGGATYTRAPLPGSPAIDAGDNVGCPITDQRGVVRPLDGNGDSAAICDIGAYEYIPGVPVFVPVTDLTIEGPVSGAVQTSYVFSVSVQPAIATMVNPVIWEATDQTPVTYTSVLTRAFTWNMAGKKIITVTTMNAEGTVVDTHTIMIGAQVPVVGFTSGAYSVGESAGSALITVTLNQATALTATVDYTTGSGTATEGEDYTTVSGTLTFTPGITSRTFAVAITNDTLDEDDETVILTLSNPSNVAIGNYNPATLSISDNDPPPTVDFSSATYSVNEDASTAVIPVTLSAASGLTVTVRYATSDGTATAGSDYVAISGTLTFNPGVTSRTFAVAILDGEMAEGEETVILTLSNPSNTTLGGHNPAVLTITEEFKVYLPLVLRGYP